MDDRAYLLKLQRKYTKDDIVLYQKQEISKLQIELGQAKSYIEELEETIKNKEPFIEKEDSTLQIVDGNTIKDLTKQVKSLYNKINDHKKEVTFWRDKYLSETVKNKQNE